MHPADTSDGPLPAQGRWGDESELALTPLSAFTPARRVRFLDDLASHGNVRTACTRVGISPETAYKARRRDDLFARGWAAALVLAREAVEQVLAERALEGVEEAIYYRGELVGSRRRHDGRLLLAHLARLDRRADELRGDLAHDTVERFDEVLALVGGLQPEADLCDPPEDGARRSPWEDPDAPPPLPLPIPRRRFVNDTAELAADHVRWEAEEARLDAEHAALWDEAAAEEEEAQDAADDAEEPFDALSQAATAAAIEARALAGRQWDDWFARVCALVDGDGEAAGVAPPFEVKSLGRRGRRARPGHCPPRQPSRCSQGLSQAPRLGVASPGEARGRLASGAGGRSNGEVQCHYPLKQPHSPPPSR